MKQEDKITLEIPSYKTGNTPEQVDTNRFKEIISTQKIIDNTTNKEYNGLIDEELLNLINQLNIENTILKEIIKELSYTKIQSTEEYCELKVRIPCKDYDVIREKLFR